jgi:hypothetical protein
MENLDCLKPYNGKTNPLGHREALLFTTEFLRDRLEDARCDGEALADCVRCQTMFLVRTMAQLLVANPPPHMTEGDENA